MSSAPIKLDPTTHHALSGTPEEHLARRAVIFQHTKNATTQGRQTSKDWAIRFGSAERYAGCRPCSRHRVADCVRACVTSPTDGRTR